MISFPLLVMSGAELLLLGPRYAERRLLAATWVGTLLVPEVDHPLLGVSGAVFWRATVYSVTRAR